LGLAAKHGVVHASTDPLVEVGKNRDKTGRRSTEERASVPPRMRVDEDVFTRREDVARSTTPG
jgi:hypothetical protein